MRTVFAHWKYLIKNLWFVLPFAVLPAVFLALSVDHQSIGALVRAFFTGEPRLHFHEYFAAFSLLRFNEIAGGVFDVLAFLSVVVCGAFLVAFTEKHLRIGKRTTSGVVSAALHILPSVLAVTLLYLALYELWALLLSAFAFAIAQLKSTPFVYLLFLVAFLAVSYCLMYVATIFYLWLPCRQLTGFGPYNAFVYSYRLMMGVRWPLVLSFAVSFLASLTAVGALSLTHVVVFRVVSVALFAVLFLSFTLRMLTVYFAQDKLDREDEIKSYRGY